MVVSGGHYDYAYQSIDRFIREFQHKANTPIRQAFLKQIARVSQAMHDIEWVDSGDYSEGDEDNAIIKCLGIGWRNIAYEQVLEEVKKIEQQLEEIKNK